MRVSTSIRTSYLSRLELDPWRNENKCVFYYYPRSTWSPRNECKLFHKPSCVSLFLQTHTQNTHTHTCRNQLSLARGRRIPSNGVYKVLQSVCIPLGRHGLRGNHFLVNLTILRSSSTSDFVLCRGWPHLPQSNTTVIYEYWIGDSEVRSLIIDELNDCFLQQLKG